MKLNPIVFLVIALVLFVVAIGIGMESEPWEERGTASSNAIAANNLAGLTACGFAIAGGLSVVAAAIAASRGNHTGN